MGDNDSLKINHFLIVQVGDKKFAFDINEIETVKTCKTSVKVGDMEDLKAFARIQKKIVPVIHLRQKFVLKRNSEQPYFPSLVFLKNKIGNEVSFICAQVDRILEIAEVNQQHIKRHKFGYDSIEFFSSLKLESVLLIKAYDIIREQDLTLAEQEMMN